jgi:hypothetical protein
MEMMTSMNKFKGIDEAEERIMNLCSKFVILVKPITSFDG